MLVCDNSQMDMPIKNLRAHMRMIDGVVISDQAKNMTDWFRVIFQDSEAGESLYTMVNQSPYYNITDIGFDENSDYINVKVERVEYKRASYFGGP